MVNLLTRDALHLVVALFASPSDEPGSNLASAYLVLNCRCAAWLHPTGPPMRLRSMVVSTAKLVSKNSMARAPLRDRLRTLTQRSGL
jgi:hypothetical protein